MKRQREDKSIIDEYEEEIEISKKRRKRARQNQKLVKELQNDSEGDEQFTSNFENAANKFSQKRKKKYKFNEAGIPFEPFHIKDELRTGSFRDGYYQDKRNDDSWDPWLLSIEEEMKKKEKQDALRENDSDAESSVDEDVDPLEEELGIDISTKTKKKKPKPRQLTADEIEEFKDELSELLEKKENVNKAMVRLKAKLSKKVSTQKPKVGKKGRKKEVEEKVEDKNEKISEEKRDLFSEVSLEKDEKLEETNPTSALKDTNAKEEDKEGGNEELENEEDQTKFNRLLEISTLLFDNGYSNVYFDSKEDIQFDFKQFKLLKERKAKEEERKKNGWMYKVIQKQKPLKEGTIGPVEKVKEKSQQYGPFDLEQIQLWKQSGYFEENDDHYVKFKMYKELNNDFLDWIPLQEIVFDKK